MGLKSPIKEKQHLFITEMIDEEIIKNPTAIAVIESENNFTYESLDQFINIYSQAFLKKKIKKADVIAIIGESSFLQIAAIIGCWKVAAVILTIDPTLPFSRILQMIKDANVKLIISSGKENLAERIIQETAIPFFNLQDIKSISRDSVKALLKPEDPAYIFFTSGSTGKPKGILGSHKGLSHFIDWQRKLFKISVNDRCAQLTSVAFDVVLRSIFTPLCSGASVVIPPSRELVAASILPWMKEKKVTMVHLVPSLARLWLSKNFEYSLPDLRWVFFAGEKLHSSLLDTWRTVIKSSAKFVNLYGPTETTLAKCFYRVTGNEQPGIYPVGHPLPETKIFILNNKKKIRKIGEVGEIVIKSPYISLGYLHKEPTSGFKKDMFFTGDLGFINKKNELEILGRKDHQVKYNGVRIEVEEIEIILNAYSAVKDCAVAIKKYKGLEYLVAFLKAKNKLNVDDLRSYLKIKLPETLIPNLYVKLVELPYTKSGKLARKNLPDLSEKITILRSNKISPEISSDTERTLLAIWIDILKLDDIGLNENFFTIGGNSLQAMRIIARVAERFGINVPQTTLMQHPTILEQAKDINRRLDSKNHPLRKSDIKYRVKKYFPLSVNQQEYWYYYINNPKSPVYNVYKVFEIKGNLNRFALEQALLATVKKHPLLFARFSERKDGGVQQTYFTPIANILYTINCRSNDLETKIQEIISTPFDLLNEYPFRFYLYTGNKNSSLILNFHHIVVDGWSSSLILKTINEYYQQFLQEKPSISDQNKINYQHFVALQGKWLTSKECEVMLAYWKNELHDCQATEILPDFTIKKSFEYRGEMLSKLVSHKSIDNFCKEAQITPYTFFYTALNIFLARYTQTSIITLGSPVANRVNHLTEDMVGPLVNTLVFRLPIHWDLDLMAHLKLSYQKIINNLKHQETPFSTVYLHLLKNKIIQQNERLFSIFFYTESNSENDLKLPDISITYKDSHNHTSKFDLSFCIVIHPENYQIKIEFNTELYKRETINQLLILFSDYLIKLIENPNLPLKELALSDTIDIESLSYLRGKQVDLKGSVLNAIFKKSNKTDLIAVQNNNKKISYKLLFNEVDKLSAYLLRDKNFFSSQKTIAVCMDRSSHAVLAMLAILKAGKIYVPINMQAPSDRIKKIIKKTNPDLIITTTHYEKIIQSSARDYINIETFKHKSRSFLKPIDSSPKLAYLVFTSGTTGEPKGILQTHDTLTNLIYWQIKQIPSKNQNVALFSSFGFDVSIQEVLYSLYTQSTLCVIPEECKRDARELWCYLIKYKVNVFFAPPQILYMLCCIDDWKNTVPSLKYIIVAGEALKIGENEKRFFSRFKDIQLINQYGPSESHVVTSYTMPFDPALWPESPPIGSSIDNIDILISDNNGNILPKNTVGELYIAGMNLAEGYYHDREQTHEKFIYRSYPYSKYTKFYKTGDLAKINTENQLIYLGRIDRQVKMLGYRIELVDIEINLSDHPNIKMCAVTIKTVSEKDTLIAYIIPKKLDYNVEGYKLFLDERLPDYMVPKLYIHLKKMPMTENGKVDVRALSIPKIRVLAKEKPKTKFQKQISKLWQDLLHLSSDDIDINTSFFNIGGTSLLAVKLLVSLERIVKIRIKIRTIYEKPSIKELASFLQKNQYEQFELLPLFKAPIQELYPLTDQQSFWWILDKIAKSNASNIQFTITILQPITIQIIKKCLNVLVNENTALRVSIEEIDGTPMQRIHSFALPSIKTIDLSKEDANTKIKMLQSIFDRDSKKYFNLKNSPLYRVILIKFNKKKTLLYFCFHHIIFDEWSMNLFSQRILQLIALHKANKELVPKKQDFSYEDYVYTQQKWKSKSLLENSKKFWDTMLESASRDNHILYDKQVVIKYGAIERIYLKLNDKKTFSYYTKKIAKQNVTTFTAMLTLYRLTIYFFVSQINSLIGVPFLNRERVEFTEILGLLTNTIPINITVNSESSFIEICQQVNSLVNQVRDNINYTFNPENLLENFNFMFIYKNSDVNTVVDTFYGKGEKTQFDLALICIKKTDSIQFIFEYNSDLFHKNSIQNFIDVFKNLFFQVPQNELKSINQYKINSKSREEFIIKHYCHGSQFFHSYKNAFEIFENTAAKNPKLTALQFHEYALTYEEVFKKCSLIANQLLHCRHKIIGIFFNRGVDMIVVILAALKAGAAYIPLDPNYPEQQLKYIYDQSGMDCILTNSNTLASLNTEFIYNHPKLINIDHIKLCHEPPNIPQVCLNDLAYIIYTSGSTGKPKGVLVTHGNLVNTILASNKYLKIPKNNRFSQFFSINFDASLLDIFLCFHCEGTLYILDETTRKQPESLILFFRQNKINISTLTPALLSIFQKTVLPDLHTFILGGETPEQFAMDYWSQGRTIYNAYGPTETTITATIYRYKKNDDIRNIGKPLANFFTYILNENLQILPTGALGELYIGGKSLAQGYLGRDDLTEKHFISIPHIDGKTKLYKTGDRVYWNSEGDIIFMGRNDSQIKFRGYRIELGNIEAGLSQLNYINQCVVSLTDQGGVRHLTAYYTLRDKTKNNNDIRNDLRKILPDYMIPTQYMCLDYLPITANGKIDKQNLPKSSFEFNIKKILPKTKLEKDIAAIWASVLGIPINSIGINDSFYELGGQSLSLAKMVSELSAKHGIRVNYANFMSNPSIEFIIEQISSEGDTISIERKDIKQAIEDIQVSFPKNKFSMPANFQSPQHILLTGATGFVGTYLLQVLLQNTTATIHCLTRDANKISNARRIKNYVSDLSKPYLELKKEDYIYLSHSIDAVYHCAAYVNHILGYKVLRNTNVLATKTLIDLITTGKPKAFHYISTISCATIENELGQIIEAWPSETPPDSGGYALSKWAAECLVKKAKEANYHCSIYRLGNVTGDTVTGYSRMEINHTYLFLKGCLQMGYAPEMNDFIEMTPVDIVAKAIYSLSTHPDSQCQVYQLNNPALISWDNLFRVFTRIGNTIELIPFSEWQTEHLSKIDETNALYPLKALYMGETEFRFKKYVTYKTQKLLKELQINYPKDYVQLLALYDVFSKKINFF